MIFIKPWQPHWIICLCEWLLHSPKDIAVEGRCSEACSGGHIERALWRNNVKRGWTGFFAMLGIRRHCTGWEQTLPEDFSSYSCGGFVLFFVYIYIFNYIKAVLFHHLLLCLSFWECQSVCAPLLEHSNCAAEWGGGESAVPLWNIKIVHTVYIKNLDGACHLRLWGVECLLWYGVVKLYSKGMVWNICVVMPLPHDTLHLFAYWRGIAPRHYGEVASYLMEKAVQHFHLSLAMCTAL